MIFLPVDPPLNLFESTTEIDNVLWFNLRQLIVIQQLGSETTPIYGKYLPLSSDMADILPLLINYLQSGTNFEPGPLLTNNLNNVAQLIVPLTIFSDIHFRAIRN